MLRLCTCSKYTNWKFRKPANSTPSVSPDLINNEFPPLLASLGVCPLFRSGLGGGGSSLFSNGRCRRDLIEARYQHSFAPFLHTRLEQRNIYYATNATRPPCTQRQPHQSTCCTSIGSTATHGTDKFAALKLMAGRRRTHFSGVCFCPPFTDTWSEIQRMQILSTNCRHNVEEVS